MPATRKEHVGEQLPDHLIGVSGYEWAFWKTIGLRGAGFPASQVSKLSAPSAAAAADQVSKAQEGLERVKSRALEEVSGAIEALRRDNQWDDKKKRESLFKTVRLIKAGKLADEKLVLSPESREALRAAALQMEAAKKDFEEQYAASVMRTTAAICEVARSSRFREALIWQNRQALHTAINILLKKSLQGTARDSKQRQYEELIASYLQRYCLKNDTIGFFGPVGWAKFVEAGEPLVSHPGAELLATRQVYFEGWCIDALANIFGKNEAVRPWIAPLRVPFFRLEGLTLHHPLFGSPKLNPRHAAVLEACDGVRTAKEIALSLAGRPDSDFKNEAEVYAVLKILVSRGLIFWDFCIPTLAFPERILRSLLNRIGEEQTRNSVLRPLDDLENARAEIAAAAGSPDQLDLSIGNLESTFMRLTGQSSTRAAGETYAGRTLIYEDCRRNIKVEIGPEILNHLMPPLSLLLTSARWFTYQLSSLYRVKFDEIYTEMARKTGSAMVDPMNFWLEVSPLVSSDKTAIAKQVSKQFEERWSAIFSLSAGQTRRHYTTAELLPRVLEAFPAPGPGWPLACYHSPDVMIAASSVEAIQRGDYQLVLGEMHPGTNTLGASLFVNQHENPQELHMAVGLDVPVLQARPLTPKDWPKLNSRTHYSLAPPSELRLELSKNSFAIDRSKVLPISALVLVKADGELVLQTRDGRARFDALQVMGGAFNGMVLNSFRVLSARRYTPRISIDRLLVCRESWRFAADELPFAFEKNSGTRFIEARKWARERDIPRFIFTKVPVEPKPFFVDFESPIYIDLFSKSIRHTKEKADPQETIGVSEMIPSPDQLWLEDAQGNRYTSELRIVALDLLR